MSMSGRNVTLSPVSVDSHSGTDWSPVSRYQNVNGSDHQYSPTLPPPNSYGNLGRAPLITPPTSHHASASISDGIGNMPPRSNGNPSPPSSVGRSSDGTGLYANNMAESLNGRKAGGAMEEAMAEHYGTLKTYLGPYLNDEKGNPRPNRARDKLLRLSVVQFQELSTDVYDESLRREDERSRGGANAPGNDIPPSLPPKNSFHPKRNQARQKLSTLPLERFRQLASDVFYELERRFPQFGGAEIVRAGSPALSTTSTRSGMSRRGPPGAMRAPPGARPGLGHPPRNGSLGGMSSTSLGSMQQQQNDFGRPLPKTFQSNTIIPNKSTLVEDDDDQSNMDDDDDDQDAFGLEGAARGSRRTTNKSLRSLAGRDSKAMTELQQQLTQLQEKLEAMETTCRDKDAEIEKLRATHEDKEQSFGSERNEWSDLRYNLERKLSDAQNLHKNLESELEKARADNASVERNIRAQLDDTKKQHQQVQRELQQTQQQHQQQLQQMQKQTRNQYNDGADDEWRHRYNELEKELREQQQVTDDVRREAEQFLEEMRVLSAHSDQAMEKEERLASQVAQLEAELREWKARYARAKTQLRAMRTSSLGMSSGIQSPDANNYVRDAQFARPDGVVRDVHLTRFQLAIDELLQVARRKAVEGDGEAVLTSMKNVVVCVRKITADVDAADAASGINGVGNASPASSTASNGVNGVHGYDATRQHAKLKARVSATANNLITASKNHAASAGLSPVSLLDAAASHLATAVVELVKAVKIRPTPADELDDEDYDDGEKPLLSVTAASSASASKSYLGLTNGYGHSRTRSKNGSGSTIYSGASSPRLDGGWSSRRSDAASSINGGLPGASQRNTGLYEFKNYLDDQTAILVQNIQPLVHTIRSAPPTAVLAPDEETAISNYITQISRAVHDTADRTHATIEASPSAASSPTTAIDADLRGALARHAPPVVDVLEAEARKLVDVRERMREPTWREKASPVAFRIARAMKELTLRVERIESGELTEEQSLGNDF